MNWSISDYNGILTDLKAKVQNHLATPRDADVMVMWQDCAGSYRDLLEAFKQVGYNKPTYCVQHGRGSTLDYGAPNNWPLLVDKFLCWGVSDYNRLSSLGFQEKAHIVGCPLNSHIKPRVEHKEKIVLFVPVNTGKEEPENIAAYYELLKIRYDKAKMYVMDSSKMLKDKWGFNGKNKVNFNEISVGFDVAAKLLPWHERDLYHGNTVVGYQDSYKNNELLFNLLRNVDLVVGLDEGTTEIFAYAHDVPVIIVDGFQYRLWKNDGKTYEPTDTYRTKAAVHTNLEGLKEAVEHALLHPEHLREERKEVAEQELGISYGDATSNIFKFIRNDVKTTCNPR